MNIVKIALIAATLAAPAFAANAAPSRLSDVQYIAANRCLGLMDSKSLGPVNDHAMKALIADQTRGRDAMVWDMGDKANQDALSDAGRARGYTKDQLIAERDGACAALLPPTQTTAAPTTSHND